MDTKSSPRHYEIDALRVIALVLLIIYHIFVCYQPFANTLQFLQYEKQLTDYWFIGDLLNIWRIPVLFVVSGMAAGFVLRRRTVTEFLTDRIMRLVPPLAFTTFIIYPVFPAIYAAYHGKSFSYVTHPGHLWFVLNLVTYAILLLPLVYYIKKKPDNFIVRGLRATAPFALLVVFPLALMLESAVFKPESFAFFPMRFFYGFICYIAGFLMLAAGEEFWTWIRRVCHIALPVAALFYLGRMEKLDFALLAANHWTTGFESAMWMLAFLGYGSLLLNRPSKVFGYLNQSVFPVYIIHMPVQQLVAFIIFRWKLSGEVTFALHVVITLGLCWLIYELVIRRLLLLYPVMGLKSSKPIFPVGLAKIGTIATLFVLAPAAFLIQSVMVLGGIAVQFAVENKPKAVKSDSLWSAAKNNDVEKLKTYIGDGKTPINQFDPKLKLGALHMAALNGSTESVAFLLEAGADVDLKIEDKSTPLGHAAFMGHPDIVKLLIENGAEINPINIHNATPLDSTYADWKMVIGVAKFLGLTTNKEHWEKGKIEVREILKEHGGKHRTEL